MIDTKIQRSSGWVTTSDACDIAAGLSGFGMVFKRSLKWNKNELSSLKIRNLLFFSSLSRCECSRVQLNSWEVNLPGSHPETPHLTKPKYQSVEHEFNFIIEFFLSSLELWQKPSISHPHEFNFIVEYYFFTLIGIGWRHDPQSRPATGKSEGGPRICNNNVIVSTWFEKNFISFGKSFSFTKGPATKLL